ncbi:hypothetical protein Avbf_08322 [Armadillidium vulgare]|nr:hypothetical protein Avbf_08322 [Armadillidium vulgare]
MVTSFTTFQGILCTTSAMDTEIATPDLVTMETRSSPTDEIYLSSSSSKSSEDSDEDSFWDGVEEVDLTIPIEDLTIEEDFEDFYLFFNESMFLDIDCETFSLMSASAILDKGPGAPSVYTEGVKEEEEEEEEEEECNLCKWIANGNQTFDFFAKKQSEETTSTTRSMIGIMVAVAIVSAAIGAAIMSFLLKCKSEYIEEYFEYKYYVKNI